MSPYYNLLKEKFPQKSDVLTEIINLEAINHLPKGTEHFVSDLHGEFNAFDYILRNASGTIKSKVEECVRENQLEHVDVEQFCQLIYYPEQKIALEMKRSSAKAVEERLVADIPILILIIQFVASKYTRSKVRKAMPKEFAYIIEELLAEIERGRDKKDYFQAIVDKIRSLHQLEELVIALANLIQNLAIDHLHVVGDIYDRGPYPDTIIDCLQKKKRVDIQWGNHDITWMGAVSGSKVCMINVIRIAARYNNLSLIENRYGINLRPLIEYSQKYYQPLTNFNPIIDDGEISEKDRATLNVVQQATAVLQFKLEHRLIDRRPEFLLGHRQLLTRINYEKGTINLDGEHHDLVDFNASCIDPEQPEKLSDEEKGILKQLMYAFQSSERLLRHITFLFEKGSMYLVYNNHLLFHGCIPLHDNGDFKSLKIEDKRYTGKDLLDFYEKIIRKSYRQPQKQEDFATDLFWYLWVGEASSLFGKNAMTTFERYYIADKTTHKEKKNAYYRLRNDEQICQMILEEFDLGKESHIVNGHTPVIEKEGENPIKANGKLIVIDGGLAKGYQKKTGIAGYTLVSNSYGLQLVAHQPFTCIQDVLNGGCDIVSTKRLVAEAKNRILVKSTTIGQNITKEINHLEYLYRHFEDY